MLQFGSFLSCQTHNQTPQPTSKTHTKILNPINPKHPNTPNTHLWSPAGLVPSLLTGFPFPWSVLPLFPLEETDFGQSIFGSSVSWRGPSGWGLESKAPGFHTTAREPKRAHLWVPAFKNTTKTGVCKYHTSNDVFSRCKSWNWEQVTR